MSVNISNIVPTQTQIELLRSDLLSGRRDINTFVHKGEVGLCRVMNEDESYSTYLTGGMRDVPHLINNSREIAQKIVDSMCNIPVRVTVGNSSSFTTKENYINVATDYFDNSDLSTNQKTDILIGLSVHEASHVNSTDFNTAAIVLNKYDNPIIRELAMNIWNIIEDERIEMITGEERPGYADFLGETKKYYFDTKIKEKPQVENSPEIEKKVAIFINDLIKLIRFPVSLSDQDIINDYELLAKAKDILTPYPETSEDAIQTTFKVIDLIRSIVEDEMQKQQEQEQAQNNQQENQGSANSQEQNQSPKENGGNPNDQQQKQSKDKDIQNQSKAKTKENTQGGKPTKEEIDKTLEKILNDPQVKQQVDKMNSLQQVENTKEFSREGSERIANGLGEPERLTEIHKSSNQVDKNQYLSICNTIRKHVPSLKKAMRLQTIDKEYNIEGQETGKINSHKLSRVAAGNFNIFTRMGEEKYDTSNVCLLIDESGSMQGSRNQAAIETAILIQEALKGNPKTILSVFGFSRRFYNYIEANKGVKESLASISASGGTPTGDAMLMAAKKIRQHNKKPCLLVVITDGEPNDTSEVLRAEKKLSKDGFVVIGVGIDQAVRVEKIFKNSIVLNDLSELAPNIGKLIKRNLKHLIKPVTTVF